MELKYSDSTSVRYHKIFDYKLIRDELFKWKYKNENIDILEISNKKSKKRIERERYSLKKVKIAKSASKLISMIPTILFVGITGSLAMMNAKKSSDIDLMIITKQNTLWITRVLVYLVLKLTNFKLRDPKQKNEKDKLCLNMWLDETQLTWSKKDRNIYTAHEVAQIVPLVNKDHTFEKFLYLNRWILDFWPNAVIVHSTKCSIHKQKVNLLEKIVYKFQYWYMKSKITTEVVNSNKAIFHKNDWGYKVFQKLQLFLLRNKLYII